MVSIVGAGPVGGYLAYLLAKNGEKVDIYEEHAEIGKPVQCTGVVTSALTDILGFDVNKRFILNEINRIKILSPDQDFLELELKQGDIVLDRFEFDKFLVGKAMNNGAELFSGYKFLSNWGGKIKFKKRFGGHIARKQDILIGADGVLSRVAKANNLFLGRKFVQGVQARVYGFNEINRVEIFLGFGEFLWVVPEGNGIARVGLVGNTSRDLRDLLNKFLCEKKLKAIDFQSGLIPLYYPKVRTKDRDIFLVGDAATQVKATTYGGIIPGLMAAKELAGSILEDSGKSYEQRWRKIIGKELRAHLFMRQCMNRFSARDYDRLVNLCKNCKDILENGNRDFPAKFLLRMAIKEPNLVGLAGGKFIRGIFS